jgi:predicted O-methyltransferase YrrM
VTEIQTQLAKCFPIESQTSPTDKSFLLASIALMKEYNQYYSYVEIGSFLGGSLTPFLMDQCCTRVLSIDERERQQPDERGENFDYAGVTHNTMIENLLRHGIKTDKLQTFDGSVDALGLLGQEFDLAFIDGEHTDFACFRDFLWVLPMMKSDSLVMFHDSTLVYKSLRLIQLYLKKMALPFRFMKKADSEMSGIFFGKFAAARLLAIFGAEEAPEAFYASAETQVISYLVANRVEVSFSVKVKPPRTVAAF